MNQQFRLLYFLILTSLSSVWGQQISTTYRNTKDSSTNYYLTISPEVTPKGLLVLLPGFGELPEYVYAETDLPKEAAKQGLLVAIVTLQQGWQSFYIDDVSQKTLDDFLKELQREHKLTGKKLYLGGFSLGGSGVVRYAERATADATLLRPDAIFAIDPPLDFTRLYQSSLHLRQYGKIDVAVNEANFLISKMNMEFGGLPNEQMKRYVEMSPYCYNDTSATNASLLKNTPIRLISEPDILWQMTERSKDLYDMNTIDCVGLVNYLKTIGNTNAIYVPTSGKGYRRQQKTRNPHSWSIADPEDTIRWLLRY